MHCGIQIQILKNPQLYMHTDIDNGKLKVAALIRTGAHVGTEYIERQSVHPRHFSSNHQYVQISAAESDIITII